MNANTNVIIIEAINVIPIIIITIIVVILIIEIDDEVNGKVWILEIFKLISATDKFVFVNNKFSKSNFLTGQQAICGI